MMDSPGFLGLWSFTSRPCIFESLCQMAIPFGGGVDSFKKPKMIPNLLWGLER